MAIICVWHLELFLLNRRLAVSGQFYSEPNFGQSHNETEGYQEEEITLPGGKKVRKLVGE